MCRDKRYYKEVILKFYIEGRPYLMNRVTFKKNLCKGCGLCVLACPRQLLYLNKEEINEKGYHPAAISQQERCIACAMCATMCPDVVITVEKGV